MCFMSIFLRSSHVETINYEEITLRPKQDFQSLHYWHLGPLLCKMFSSIHGLHPQKVSRPFPTRCDSQTSLQALLNVPWEYSCKSLRTRGTTNIKKPFPLFVPYGIRAWTGPKASLCGGNSKVDINSYARRH